LLLNPWLQQHLSRLLQLLCLLLGVPVPLAVRQQLLQQRLLWLQ
jgi:hypothetical protein